MNKNKQIVIILAFLSVIVFGVVYIGISFTENVGKSQSVVSTENAVTKLEKMKSRIQVNTITPRKEPIDLSEEDLKETLPDIDKNPLQVKPQTQLYAEIFTSPEKAGKDKDGWLVEMAKAFNNSGATVNGQPVSISIRSMASGTGVDYIVSGKYIPEAFTPSNELWGEMVKTNGISIELIEKKLVGNVAGILMSQAKEQEMIQKYGAVNIKNITESVVQNEIAMGYTNPLSSSTGLNFLISTLNTFDSTNLLSDTAIAGFESFQNNVPFVSYTTLQMRDSAKSGVLDGFIMEYQTYVNSPDLKADYVFTPFGARHDSPLYAVGDISSDKKEILKLFAAYCKSNNAQQVATDYGFNSLESYVPEMESPSGDIVFKAQKLWKEKKNGNKPIAAVFVADVSGSMDGEPLAKLKQSLITGSKYISKEHSIGLVTYSNDVTINLPISKFDINHRSLFAGAVTDLEASGGTATFDGAIVALQMLLEEKEKNPDAKLMLFLLSDGDTNRGHSLNDISPVLQALKIPVYTIGYNANISALQNISSINEAASINADSDDVTYKLANLFNAAM